MGGSYMMPSVQSDDENGGSEREDMSFGLKDGTQEPSRPKMEPGQTKITSWLRAEGPRTTDASDGRPEMTSFNDDASHGSDQPTVGPDEHQPICSRCGERSNPRTAVNDRHTQLKSTKPRLKNSIDGSQGFRNGRTSNQDCHEGHCPVRNPFNNRPISSGSHRAEPSMMGAMGEPSSIYEEVAVDFSETSSEFVNIRDRSIQRQSSQWKLRGDYRHGELTTVYSGQLQTREVFTHPNFRLRLDCKVEDMRTRPVITERAQVRWLHFDYEESSFSQADLITVQEEDLPLDAEPVTFFSIPFLSAKDQDQDAEALDARTDRYWNPTLLETHHGFELPGKEKAYLHINEIKFKRTEQRARLVVPNFQAIVVGSGLLLTWGEKPQVLPLRMTMNPTSLDCQTGPFVLRILEESRLCWHHLVVQQYWSFLRLSQELSHIVFTSKTAPANHKDPTILIVDEELREVTPQQWLTMLRTGDVEQKVMGITTKPLSVCSPVFIKILSTSKSSTSKSPTLERTNKPPRPWLWNTGGLLLGHAWYRPGGPYGSQDVAPAIGRAEKHIQRVKAFPFSQRTTPDNLSNYPKSELPSISSQESATSDTSKEIPPFLSELAVENGFQKVLDKFQAELSNKVEPILTEAESLDLINTKRSLTLSQLVKEHHFRSNSNVSLEEWMLWLMKAEPGTRVESGLSSLAHKQATLLAGCVTLLKAWIPTQLLNPPADATGKRPEYWGAFWTAIATIFESLHLQQCREWAKMDVQWLVRFELQAQPTIQCEGCALETRYATLAAALDHLHTHVLDHGIDLQCPGRNDPSDPCIRWIRAEGENLHNLEAEGMADIHDMLSRFEKATACMIQAVHEINIMRDTVRPPPTSVSRSTGSLFLRWLFSDIALRYVVQATSISWIASREGQTSNVVRDQLSSLQEQGRQIDDSIQWQILSTRTRLATEYPYHMGSASYYIDAELLLLFLVRNQVRDPLSRLNGTYLQLSEYYRQIARNLSDTIYAKPGRGRFREIANLRGVFTALQEVKRKQVFFLDAWEGKLQLDQRSLSKVDFLDGNSLKVVNTTKRLYLRTQIRRDRDVEQWEGVSIRHADELRALARDELDLMEEDHGKAIRVFTFVTVLFLPMSFVTSFFGMNFTDIRDTKSSSPLFWQIAVPLTTTVIVLAWAYSYHWQDIREYLANEQHRSDVHERTRKWLLVRMPMVMRFGPRQRQEDVSSSSTSESTSV